MTKVVARFRDSPRGPPTSWVLFSFHPYPSIEQERTGPHPSGEGRGTGGWRAWLRESWGGECEAGVVGRRKDEPNINRDAVDDGFKLRSHAQSLSPISTLGCAIEKIKGDYLKE